MWYGAIGRMLEEVFVHVNAMAKLRSKEQMDYLISGGQWKLHRTSWDEDDI